MLSDYQEAEVIIYHRKEAKVQPDRRPIFRGDVNTEFIVDPSAAKSLIPQLVRFSPGARTNWHRHSFEQGLVIVEGRGIVATEEAEHVVETGDVIVVPAEERHWHGATETTAMAHIAINQPGETTVLEPTEEIRTKDV